MSTHVDFHQFTTISARALETMGAPLIVTVWRDAPKGSDSITLFTGSHDLSFRIAEAINAAVDAHEAERNEVAA